MPTTPQGKIAEPRGTRARPGRIKDDPRWTRALPWLSWLKGPFGISGLLAASGLALFNVILPLSILRLLTGRRRFSIKALMALPVAAAVPLMMFIALEPVLPAGSAPLLSSEKRVFVAGTAAGLPIVVSVLLVACGLARGRWRPLSALAALTMLTSLVIAAAWLWFDMKSMSSMERYGRADWYLVILPGAYVASLLMLIGWLVRGAYRLAKRSRVGSL